jgi:hypothetical protein
VPPTYTIAWPASLGRPLPDGTAQPLLGVEIRRRAGSAPDAVGRDDVELVTSEIATNAGDALQVAHRRIRTAAAATEIVLNTACQLGPTPEVHGDDGSTLVHASMTASGAVRAKPIEPADLANAPIAARTWARLAADERDRLERALRWYARATRCSDPLDTLLGAWIAFETVVKHGKRSGSNNPLLDKYAIPALRRILPAAPKAGVQHLLREIYDVERGEVIHNAKAELDDTQRGRATVALTRAVLEDALGLPVDVDGTAQGFIAGAAAAHAARCTVKCSP